MNNPVSLPTTPEVIKRRLTARISGTEYIGILILFGIIVCLLYVAHLKVYFPYDYRNYRNAVLGDPSFYYYGYWFLPVFSVLNLLPDILQLLIYFTANSICVFFAARMFTGKASPLIFGYQMYYSLYFGQLTGMVIGGMALLWWGIVHKRWNIAGFGLILLLTKYQLGIPVGLTLCLIANILWSDRLRILVVPFIIGLLSLAIYGFWPLEVLQRITVGNPPDNWGSLSLWHLFGPVVLIFWIPVLLLPLSPTRRIIAVISATALALPYFQQADLIALYVFPVGWFPVLGNIGFLSTVFETSFFKLTAVVPLVIYIWTLVGHFSEHGIPQLKRFARSRPLTG